MSESAKIKCTILGREILDIPSASGVSVIGSTIYVIGDNSPWLYKLNSEYAITGKIQLNPGIDLPDGIYAKKDKPDFEALATVKTEGTWKLLAFGSGSKSPQRDVLAVVAPEDLPKLKSYSLIGFYDQLKASAKLTDAELNIEAAEIIGDRLFLFNRRKNLLFEYKLSEFFNYLNKKGENPFPKIYKFSLPDISGIEAGFTGAGQLHGDQKIIFTATVEDTPNNIDDGEVLGSFIGVISLTDLQDHNRPDCIPIAVDSELLKIKVESVTMLDQTKTGEAEILMVTDSDGGLSEIINARLKWE
ncbi:MAG: hypothetical protein JJE07_08240 [Flavobacteriaceae bacterium]|nr:hypothetical protein [Flavobacteriaceae bacterium]